MRRLRTLKRRKEEKREAKNKVGMHSRSVLMSHEQVKYTQYNIIRKGHSVRGSQKWTATWGLGKILGK